MTFVSYAQNREDVLLKRVLREVDRGFYIDVGAGHPVIDSVTKSFYDAGWSGVNVEPNPEYAALLAEQRPRDITLGAALGTVNGVVTFNLAPDLAEVSTTTEAGLQSLHDAGVKTEATAAPMISLQSIVDTQVHGEVHFLKVDVEGAEVDVLSSVDLDRFRPWIIIAEVIAYGRDARVLGGMEQLLLPAAYVLVHFDGLNQWWVAREHVDALKPAFEVPVNVTDDYSVADAARADWAFSEVARILGIAQYGDHREVLSRLHALVDDRIQFENRATTSEEIASSMQLTLDGQAGKLAEFERLEQVLWERERHVAWLSSELARTRADADDDVRASHAERAGEVAILKQEIRSLKRQIRRIKGSKAYRASLRLRGLRHPFLLASGRLK